MSGPGATPAPGDAPAAALVLGTARGRWVLAATVLGSGIASLDATVVGIALPSISRSFGGGVGTLQWVVTGYSLTLAAFLLLGGSLGDRFGRRRIFSIGIAWFAVASAACGFAPNAALLVVARVVQGVGGALLTPGSLAILQASFRDDDRSRAIGAWSGLAGVATAAGPLVGGYLLAVASWRWVFFINVPVAAAVLVLTARHVPETPRPDGDPPHRRARALRWPSSSWPGSPTGSSRGPRVGGAIRWSSPPSWSPPSPRRPSSSSKGAAPTRCCRWASSASASSAGPTPSPSWSTARSAGRSSSCRWSSRWWPATARSTRGSPCCR